VATVSALETLGVLPGSLFLAATLRDLLAAVSLENILPAMMPDDHLAGYYSHQANGRGHLPRACLHLHRKGLGLVEVVGLAGLVELVGVAGYLEMMQCQ
jgi:hypothetical protein